jgi:hypothetical protein
MKKHEIPNNISDRSKKKIVRTTTHPDGTVVKEEKDQFGDQVKAAGEGVGASGIFQVIGSLLSLLAKKK